MSNFTNEFLKYYYATQIHSKTIKKSNGTSLAVGSNIKLSGDSSADYTYQYQYTMGNGTWNGSLSIDLDQAINDAGGLLEENADNYFDNFDVNYSILDSLNTLQLRYDQLILDLQEKRAQYEASQAALGPTNSTIPGEFSQEQETLKIQYALAQYLAALGYRYYHEVEMLYKK